MQRTGKGAALVAAGILIGSALGGSAAYAATGVLAERSTMPILVNGRPAQAEAYLIEGSNYLKLRDVAALADFGVTWDAASRTVCIDTSVGYTSEVSATAADYSAQVNAEVFTGSYTRALYNDLRESIVSEGPSRSFPLTDEATRHTCWDVTAAFGSWPGYRLTSAENGAACFILNYPAAYEEAAAHCRPFLDSLAGMSEQEKVRQLAFYVCDHLRYSAADTPTPRTVFAEDAEHPANCMAYAHSFLFLCDLADIPCVLVHSETHQWNEVYVGGRWMSVDVGGADAWDAAQRQGVTVLHEATELQGADYIQTDPALTRFVKELLVPGSTEEHR